MKCSIKFALENLEESALVSTNDCTAIHQEKIYISDDRKAGKEKKIVFIIISFPSSVFTLSKQAQVVQTSHNISSVLYKKCYFDAFPFLCSSCECY
jgi:hypothetical protein